MGSIYIAFLEVHKHGLKCCSSITTSRDILPTKNGSWGGLRWGLSHAFDA